MPVVDSIDTPPRIFSIFATTGTCLDHVDPGFALSLSPRNQKVLPIFDTTPLFKKCKGLDLHSEIDLSSLRRQGSRIKEALI